MPMLPVSRRLYLCKVISTPSAFDITHYPVVGFESAGVDAGKPYAMRDGSSQKAVIGVSTIAIPPAPPVAISLLYDGDRKMYIYNGAEYLFNQLQQLVGFSNPYGV